MSAVRPDPAPSRLQYKLQRWWLTPIVRATVRVGVPAFLLAFSAGFYLSNPRTVESLSLTLLELRRSIEQRPEFMVHAMRIEGASDELAQDVTEAMGLDFPISSFDLELPKLVEVVAGLDAVAEVNLSIRPGGVLEVALEEREAALVWRSLDALEAIDKTGHRVGPLTSREARADLPLIVGEGADDAADEALALFAAAQPIAPYVAGLVRVSARRWDVVLIDGPRIKLPAEGAEAALNRVLAAHGARDLLARDIAVVDMRVPQRPTLQLTETGRSGVVALREQAAEQRQQQEARDG